MSVGRRYQSGSKHIGRYWYVCERLMSGSNIYIYIYTHSIYIWGKNLFGNSLGNQAISLTDLSKKCSTWTWISRGQSQRENTVVISSSCGWQRTQGSGATGSCHNKSHNTHSVKFSPENQERRCPEPERHIISTVLESISCEFSQETATSVH